MDIAEWLVNQLNDTSMRELARKCSVSHSTISDIISGKRVASRKFCEAMADGLGLERAYVLQLGGYDPDESIQQAARDLQIARELRGFNDNEIELVRSFAKMLREQRKSYEADKKK